MIRAIEGLLKPEYLLQPRRLLRRLAGRTRAAGVSGTFALPLPWGVSMEVGKLDDIGRIIDRLGVYDLVVTETIWRLVHPGDTVIDVGANVGFMSVAMIARLGRRGRVFPFEPHPDLYRELTRNLAAAHAAFPGVEVLPRREAVSDVAGNVWLGMPDGFDANRGLARIGPAGEGIEVAARCLDDHAAEMGPDIALMKIDVEGHEVAAFRGAKSLLESGAIRHVIMEEHGRVPTEATALLESHGYTIFSLERTLLGPRLGDAANPRRSGWEAPSVLATRRPAEARSALEAYGWRALRS